MLKDLTNETLDTLFPDQQLLEQKSDENIIYIRTCCLVGRAGAGKTTVIRALTYEARKKYGRTNVNAKQTKKGNVRRLMAHLANKQVNILFVDNFTDALERVPKEQQVSVVRKFFDLRHHLQRRFGRKTGLVLVAFGLHDLYATSPKLRSEVDVWIFRSAPTGEHRRRVTESYVKEEGFETLKHYDKLRRRTGYTAETMSVSVVYIDGEIGTVKLGKPPKYNPARPPKKFMDKCTREVKKKGVLDPSAVCGDLWHHKMSKELKRKWIAYSEGRGKRP